MAARKSKQAKARNQPSPALDNPRWLTMTMAHHSRSEQLIGARFSDVASRRLREALKGEKLRCMRETGTNPPEREPVPASFWQDHWIAADPDTGIQILPTQPTRRDPRHFWIYYVWKPDFDKLWPPAKADQKSESPMRRKPGRKPKENWQAFVLGALAVFLEEGRQVPPATYFALLSEKNLGYQPDLREIQKLISKDLSSAISPHFPA